MSAKALLATLVPALAFAQAPAPKAMPIPSDAKLRQTALQLYPAVMGREDLESPFVMGVIYDHELAVARHSAALPRRGAVTTGLLAEMFQGFDPNDCESAGMSALRSPRGVGGQFDKGAFAVWCVLRKP